MVLPGFGLEHPEPWANINLCLFACIPCQAFSYRGTKLSETVWYPGCVLCCIENTWSELDALVSQIRKIGGWEQHITRMPPSLESRHSCFESDPPFRLLLLFICCFGRGALPSILVYAYSLRVVINSGLWIFIIIYLNDKLYDIFTKNSHLNLCFNPKLFLLLNLPMSWGPHNSFPPLFPSLSFSLFNYAMP